jgi:GABA(A) receptor-associated protein
MTQFNYDINHSFDERVLEINKIRLKFPDKIPALIQKNYKSDIPSTSKSKFLIPHDLTVGQLNYIIRKNIKLTPEKALFIFINNTLPPTSALMSSIYEKHKSKDGFLRITYSGENTFG